MNSARLAWRTWRDAGRSGTYSPINVPRQVLGDRTASTERPAVCWRGIDLDYTLDSRIQSILVLDSYVSIGELKNGR